MHKEEDSYDPEEGARPSSLIAVHKLATPDPIYDLQLMRDLEIINARTRADLGPLPPGGVPARSDRRPDVRPFTTTEESQEKTMKIQDIAMVAALSVATSGGAVANEGTASKSTMLTKANVQKPSAMAESQKVGVVRAAVKPDQTLDPEYMKIQTFSAFRKKILEDGWMPIPNPDCHDAVKGGDYDESCREDPDSIGCRVCTVVPELFRHTSDDYNLMRYTKGGVPLGVTVYGDIRDLDSPGRYGLEVVGWEYREGLNVILMDD